MENIKMFSGGMNKDLSKSVYKDGCYIHAENFTLITDVGLSTGSLRNTNGNVFYIDIPTCSNVVEITISNFTVPLDITLDINSYVVTFNNINSLEALGEAIQNDINLKLGFYGIAYNDDRLVIYSLLSNNALVNPTITVLGSIVPVGAPPVPAPVLNINNSYVPAQATPSKILGWVTIRDEIFLFTSLEEQDPVTNPISQIWKLTYDKYTFNPVISLLYTNALNFTLAHPIPNPGGGVGNFETPAIKKIYWTDNFNKPRYCNTADPNLMALTVDQLEMVPKIAHGIAAIKQILPTGNIKTGIYYVSARLKKLAGGSSDFLVPSNGVPIINPQESDAFDKYEARDTGVDVSKSIQGILYNLDTDYDTVEPVIIYRKTGSSTPDVYLLPEEPIPTNGVVIFTYSGGEVTIPITLEELLTTNINFITVKTMTAKNNMLFFGNVKYGDFDVDFDARAYRFTGKFASNGTIGRNNQEANFKTEPYTIVGPNPNWATVTIPETADVIQDIHMQAPNTAENYLYQSDGVTFGGEGPNVKYEFVKMNTYNDTSINSLFRTQLDDTTKNDAPYASIDQSTVTVDFDDLFGASTDYNSVTNTNAYYNASSPYVQYGLKGYQRDEVYRFGIVFYSLTGEPSYVHWVGDIRMPKPYMPDPNDPNPLNRNLSFAPIASMDSGGANSDFDFSRQVGGAVNVGSDRKFYGNNLGIKFTVDVSNINTQISGYSIVRCIRTDQDKTILGQGIVSQVWYQAGGNGAFVNYTVAGGSYGTWEKSYHPYDFGNPSNNTLATFASPEFLFKTHPSYSNGDELDILQTNETFWGINWIPINRTTDGSNERNNHPYCNPSGEILKYYTPWGYGWVPRQTGTLVSGSDYELSSGTPIPFQKSIVLRPGDTTSVSFTGGALPSADVANYPYTYNIQYPCENDIDIHIKPQQATGATPRSYGGTRLLMVFDWPSGTRSLDSIGNTGTWDGMVYGYDFIRNSSDGFNRLPTNNPNWYIGNYRRPTVVQYGGNTFSARSYSEYISTNHIQIVNRSTTSNTNMIFGGDTLITLFDYTTHLRNPNVYGKELNVPGTNPNVVYNDTFNQIMLTAVESSIPVELRKENAKPANVVDDGYTSTPRCAPNKSDIYDSWPNSISGGGGPSTTAEWTEVFNYDRDYINENDILKFFPKPNPYIFQDIFDVRTHRSQVKSNGELSDSWTIFKSEDYLDLDTYQGPLNNLIIFKDRLMGFQDKGIAALSVNERSVTQDSSGSDIILGSGGVLSRYDYYSKVIGSRHQFSFTTSNDAIFWFDMNTKNAYKMQGGEQANPPVAITVAKGMSSYLNSNLNGIIQISDNPYKHKGITATYDFRYNEAIMTFRDKLPDFNKDLPTYQPTSLVYIGYNPSTGIYDFSIPILTGTNWLGTATEIVLSVKNNSTNYVAYVQPPSAGADISLSFSESVSFNVTDLITIYRLIPNAFTLGYNDFIDAYTSFYSYTPAVYVNDSVSIFTPDDNLTNLYRHDVGPHGEYYGNVYPSKVSILVNESPTETKVFDNYEIVSESIDITGANIVDDIFASIRIYNDYQNTDFQSLPIDGSKVIAKRKERTWNLSNLRNRVLYYDYNLPAVPVPSPNIFDPVYLSTTDPTILGDKVFGERLRDKYIIVDLEYDNINNYNFIFHTFKTHFRKSAR